MFNAVNTIYPWFWHQIGGKIKRFCREPYHTSHRSKIPNSQRVSAEREKGKKMEIRVRCNCGEGSCEEWGIVELQGVVEPQPGFHDSLPNLHIGTLCRPSSQVPLSHPSFFFSSYSLFSSIVIFDSASHCKIAFPPPINRQMSLVLHLQSPSLPAYIIECSQNHCYFRF